MTRAKNLFLLGFLIGGVLATPGWGESPRPTSLRVPPVVWYESDPEAARRFLMLGLFYWDTLEGESRRQVLLPFYYRERSVESLFWMALPCAAGYRRGDHHWLLAGLFYDGVSPEVSRRVLFPLYWDKRKSQGSRTRVLLPFLFYDYRNASGLKRDRWALWGFERRRGPLHYGSKLNCIWRDGPEGGFWTLFPLAWSVTSPGERWTAWGPFYRSEKEISSGQRLRHRGLFPLWDQGWGADYAHQHLLPFYWVTRQPDQEDFHTPVYSSWRRGRLEGRRWGIYSQAQGGGLREKAVWPLWYRLRREDDSETIDQVLLFYRRKNPTESFQACFPFYGRWVEGDEKRFLTWGVSTWVTPEGRGGWAGPAFWRSREGGSATQVLFPLAWRLKRPPEEASLDLFLPFYFSWRRGDTRLTVIPPVSIQRSPHQTTWSLLFLYWRDRRPEFQSTTLAPFFHQRSTPGHWRLFTPLGYLRKSPLSREGFLFPAYWYTSAEKRRRLFPPFYWRETTPAGSSLVIPPWYHWQRGDQVDQGIFPLWGRHRSLEERGGYLLPFYYFTADSQGNGLWIVPPMLGHVRRYGQGTDNPGMSYQYLILGLGRVEPRLSEHGFFPLFQYARRPDARSFMAPRILPLVNFKREGSHRFRWLFPAAWERRPEKDWTLVAPFFYESRSYKLISQASPQTPEIATPLPEAGVQVSTATFQRGAQTERWSVLLGLWWRFSSKDSDTTFGFPLYLSQRDPERQLRWLLPVYLDSRTPAGSRWSTLFPLYWRVALGGESRRRDISVLGPVYRLKERTSRGESRTWGLAPLFSRTVDDLGLAHFDILGGLIGFTRDEQGARWQWFYFLRS